MQFSFILATDTTLSGATTRVRVDLGAMVIKGYSAFPKALLEPTTRAREDLVAMDKRLLCIPQSSRITGTSALESLLS